MHSFKMGEMCCYSTLLGLWWRRLRHVAELKAFGVCCHTVTTVSIRAHYNFPLPNYKNIILEFLCLNTRGIYNLFHYVVFSQRSQISIGTTQEIKKFAIFIGQKQQNISLLSGIKDRSFGMPSPHYPHQVTHLLKKVS